MTRSCLLLKKSRLLSVLSFVFMVITVFSISEAQAFTIATRVWSTSNATYKKDSSFLNQGPGWGTRADLAALDWSGWFSFSFSASSPNSLRAESISGDTSVAITEIPIPSGLYRSTYTIKVNLCCGYPFYDGTQSPSLPANYFDLRSILTHEFGHALGLGHSFQTGLMYESIARGTTRTVDADAQNGANYLYNPNYTGPIPEGPKSSNEIANIGTHDNPSSNIGYRGLGWGSGSGFSRAYNTTASWNNQPNTKAWMHFSGDRITWQFTETWNRSTANVFIDGVDKGTFSLYDGALARWQMAKTWELPNGLHLIEVRANGSGSTGYTDLDTFVVNIPTVTSGTWDNGNGQFKYIGNWTYTTGFPSTYNSTISYSNVTENAVTFTFKGTGIT